MVVCSGDLYSQHGSCELRSQLRSNQSVLASIGSEVLEVLSAPRNRQPGRAANAIRAADRYRGRSNSGYSQAGCLNPFWERAQGAREKLSGDKDPDPHSGTHHVCIWNYADFVGMPCLGLQLEAPGFPS